jgi:hypothetical protein
MRRKVMINCFAKRIEQENIEDWKSYAEVWDKKNNETLFSIFA